MPGFTPGHVPSPVEGTIRFSGPRTGLTPHRTVDSTVGQVSSLPVARIDQANRCLLLPGLIVLASLPKRWQPYY